MRQILRSTLLSLMLAAAPTLQVARAQFIDQSQSLATQFSQTSNRAGQTFKPTQNNVSGAGAFMYNSSRELFHAVLSVELWAGGIANTPGAHMIASATRAYTLRRGATSWVDAFWSSTVMVTPGTTYFLAFGSDNSASRFGYRKASISASAYGPGDMYRGTTAGADATYNQVREGDLAFHETFVTPEPASYVLLATGLIGIFGIARRRKSSGAA